MVYAGDLYNYDKDKLAKIIRQMVEVEQVTIDTCSHKLDLYFQKATQKEEAELLKMRKAVEKDVFKLIEEKLKELSLSLTKRSNFQRIQLRRGLDLYQSNVIKYKNENNPTSLERATIMLDFHVKIGKVLDKWREIYKNQKIDTDLFEIYYEIFPERLKQSST